MIPISRHLASGATARILHAASSSPTPAAIHLDDDDAACTPEVQFPTLFTPIGVSAGARQVTVLDPSCAKLAPYRKLPPTSVTV